METNGQHHFLELTTTCWADRLAAVFTLLSTTINTGRLVENLCTVARGAVLDSMKKELFQYLLHSRDY